MPSSGRGGLRQAGTGTAAAAHRGRGRRGAVRTIRDRALSDVSKESPAGRLLATALDLFYREGLRAVGIDRLIEEAGVAKASFYTHFPSKQRLVAAYLEAWSRGWLGWLADTVAASADTESGPGPLLLIFRALETFFADPDYRGCAFTNAQADAGRDDEEVRAICRSHKAALAEYIAALALDAGCEAADALGAQMVLLIDGAMDAAVRERSPAPARLARATAEVLVAACV